jgi:hypothetical protein
VARHAAGDAAGPALVLVEPGPQVARLVLNDPGRRGVLAAELFLLAAPPSAERARRE